MFKKALEYGMTPKQFWEEDEELFIVYQEAYINKVHTKAHIEGLYIFEALTDVVSNVLMGMSKKGKTQKPKYYPSEPIYNPLLKGNIDKKEVGMDNRPTDIKTLKKSKENKQLQRELEYREKMLQWI